MNLIQHIMEDARKRLVVLRPDAPASTAAEVLINPTTPLAVVCDDQGIAVGVVSGRDIVKVLAVAKGDAHRVSTGAIMTSPVVSCRIDQPLQGVWDAMNARSLRCVPVLDDFGRPQGVVYARDLARALLNEVNEEDTLLRDYVLGVGYQ